MTAASPPQINDLTASFDFIENGAAVVLPPSLIIADPAATSR
jgi:hypothetical protein